MSRSDPALNPQASFAAISRAGARRRLSYVLVPWLTGGLVFLFRLTSLRDLTNDHYMHLSWAQQVLLGSLPGRDFVDPGMPLAWGLSAIGQALSAGPFSEAVLSCAMFGLTAAATTWVIARLTGSWGIAAVAAFTAAMLMPRLYNYPKLLVPALVLFLIERYVERQSVVRLAAVAAGIAAGVLFRHDLGLYAGIVALVAVAVVHRASMREAVRATLTLGALTALILAPYLVYVEWSEGLVEHLRRGIEFSKGESHQLRYPWPTFTFPSVGLSAWSRDDSTVFLYYFAGILPITGLLLAPWRLHRDERDRLPLALASILFLALYLPIILRYPLDQRLPDIATPMVVVAAFVIAALLHRLRHSSTATPQADAARWLRVAALALVVAIAGSAVVTAANLGQFLKEVEETRIERGPRGLLSKIRSTAQDAAVWPWVKFWPNSGDFPRAIAYVRSCAAPDSYLLVTWAAPEYFFYAQRRFASGYSMFLPPASFTTERDQNFMLTRLAIEQPPIALVNTTRAEAFRIAYPKVDTYIASHYTKAGTYRQYDDDEIAIVVRNDLHGTSTFGEEGWPCGLTPR